MITDKTIEITLSRAALIKKMARAICVSRGLKPNEDWVLFRADCDAALEAAAPEIRREAIYECAEAAEDYAKSLDERTSGAKVKSATRIEALDRMMAAHFIATAIRALKSQPAAQGDDGWRPIDDAPKDGQFIIVTGFVNDIPPERWTVVAAWFEDAWREKDYTDLSGFSENELIPPTHWAPIPPPLALPKEK